ncbi:MAG: polysaccharide deacetylase family protein [Alphaproteobacteria bacterium]|nr:polysaccharide deacetylase family protein [Alphaproteobacteria bacterium]
MEPQRYGPFPYRTARDLLAFRWPGEARLALWVIPNIEFFPLDEPVPGGRAVPDLNAWSKRDYGNRIGVFRLMDTLARFGVRGTVALNSDICTAHPQIVSECLRLEWELMGHCESNARALNAVPAEEEAAVVANTVATIARFSGRRPRGWLGAGLQETWGTLEHLADAGLDYVADWANDDQPYMIYLGDKRLVSIPYSLEINDRPAFERFYRTAAEFEQMIRDQFDVLYGESERVAKVMAIALHPFLIGMPHRIKALENALDYVLGHDGVWAATGSEIVDHFVSVTGGD